MAAEPTTVLNGICPYFTMFPLDFPLAILKKRARRGDLVLDPFCGRGTTNYAARLLGLSSLGVDSSPVAAAIAAAKLVMVTAEEIVSEAKKILSNTHTYVQVPTGEFWESAFDPAVLESLCQLRDAFLKDCSSPARKALRGIILGSLHGPKQKTFPSYFSNQCPRTYAPKPSYATHYWRNNGLKPDSMDVIALIGRRASRYYSDLPSAVGQVRQADSRSASALEPYIHDTRFNWVITSPPYYGMRTYIPDQWLRHWFLGGPSDVDYSNKSQVAHSSPTEFMNDLRKVWQNASAVSANDATLIIRFGGITDRKANPVELIKGSLKDTGWDITTMHAAGCASEGKRQADAFLRTRSKPMVEYDVWARRY